MAQLSILHFNDVYRVGEQKLPGNGGTIDVTQFAHKIDSIRNSWPERKDGKRDGLLLFSGDLFSPSVESSVTRGSHMVPIINELSPDFSLAGNHDFDFGYLHLTTLLKDVRHPWILSNISDINTGKVPASLHEFQVIERCGVRIGLIGLIEREWIATISSWPSNFKYKDVKEVSIALSKRLRDPDGPYACDLIIALTHARIPNDIQFAKVINALSPSAQTRDFLDSHGVDIILGGHDHFYYVSKGVTSWENYEINQEVLGAEEDKGDVLVLKSGTDFRDLSEILLVLEASPENCIRKKFIKEESVPDSPCSQKLREVITRVLGKVSDTMKAPLCVTTVQLDLRSQAIRTAESAAGDWVADILHHAYDDTLCVKQGYGGGADAVFICAGTLRGDTIFGPGNITLGDVLEILPFSDPTVVIELDGQTIWEAFEVGLSKWPAQEGRFPVVSGFRVIWDSRRPAGQRVLQISLQVRKPLGSHTSEELAPDIRMEYEEIPRGCGRKYSVVTRAYMAEGHDGFDCLVGSKYLVDDEQGQIMSTLVRRYLLGASYIRWMCARTDDSLTHMHSDTAAIIAQAKIHQIDQPAEAQKARQLWRQAFEGLHSKIHSPSPFESSFLIANREHMSGIDCFDGHSTRIGNHCGDSMEHTNKSTISTNNLITITPSIDDRLKDVGRIQV